MDDGDPVKPGGQKDLLVSVNDQTFSDMIEMHDGPAFVIFQSVTCQHCRTITPYIREYAGEFSGRVLFATIEVGQNPRVVERFGIRSTPTFKFFCKGKPVQELVGAVYPAIIKRQIEEFLLYGNECAANSTEIDYEISGYA
jgi:thioredoxin-like negative regulator of GroEL